MKKTEDGMKKIKKTEEKEKCGQEAGDKDYRAARRSYLLRKWQNRTQRICDWRQRQKLEQQYPCTG